ncbi:MAG: hypothetical protein ACM3IJ_05950 [Candidatus Levyibacteriota bacterium]
MMKTPDRIHPRVPDADKPSHDKRPLPSFRDKSLEDQGHYREYLRTDGIAAALGWNSEFGLEKGRRFFSFSPGKNGVKPSFIFYPDPLNIDNARILFDTGDSKTKISLENLLDARDNMELGEGMLTIHGKEGYQTGVSFSLRESGEANLSVPGKRDGDLPVSTSGIWQLRDLAKEWHISEMAEILKAQASAETSTESFILTLSSGSDQIPASLHIYPQTYTLQYHFAGNGGKIEIKQIDPHGTLFGSGREGEMYMVTENERETIQLALSRDGSVKMNVIPQKKAFPQQKVK